MKRIILGVLLSLCMLWTGTAAAALKTDCPVPEEKLHEAVLAYGVRSGGGPNTEFMAEGHIVLGCEESETAVDVYASIRYWEYGFMAGIFTDTGSGCGMIPVKLTFAKPDFDLVSIQQPDDGEYYGSSIRKMLPDAIEESWGGAENDAALVAQMETQARAYVASIGRTERVMDWRALEPPLELADGLVIATNALSFWRYPLWTTDWERVEDGVRYRYAQLWAPDKRCDGITYMMPSGYQSRTGGDTGVITWRKTRLTDGEIVEEITAQIDVQTLTVTLAQPGGSRIYRLRLGVHTQADGMQWEEYQLEGIEETGEVTLEAEDLMMLDRNFRSLPRIEPDAPPLTAVLTPIAP